MDEQSKARRPIKSITGSEDITGNNGVQQGWYDETGARWLSMVVTGDDEHKKRKLEESDDQGKAERGGNNEKQKEKESTYGVKAADQKEVVTPVEVITT